MMDFRSPRASLPVEIRLVLVTRAHSSPKAKHAKKRALSRVSAILLAPSQCEYRLWVFPLSFVLCTERTVIVKQVQCTQWTADGSDWLNDLQVRFHSKGHHYYQRSPHDFYRPNQLSCRLVVRVPRLLPMKPKQHGPVYDQVSAPQMNLGGPKLRYDSLHDVAGAGPRTITAKRTTSLIEP